MILDIVTVITSFVSGFIDFVLLLFLFRNYSPRNSFIFLVMAVLVEILGPILVFAIRKNSCEEYREFMRMKMHSMYGGGSPYQYGDGTYHDPYDLSKKQKGEENIEKPFSEYE